MATTNNNESGRSEAPSSDLTAQEQPLGKRQLLPEQTTTSGMPEPNGQHDVDDDGYASSDMDISRPATPMEETPIHAGSKRRMSNDENNGHPTDQAMEDLIKKRKLSTHDEPSPADRAPTEIWQQVFLNLSPVMLSRCLRVSKTFNACLTTTKAPVVTPQVKVAVRPIDSNAVWLAAKSAYLPGMPKIREDWTVLQMLQFLGCTTCQFCSRSSSPTPSILPWSSGPGPAGVRIIWPFSIRTCGSCWVMNTRTWVEVLQSPVARVHAGLTHAIRTEDLHYVPDYQRQSVPSHIRMEKVYYIADFPQMQEDYRVIKEDFGDAAADEWHKGLPARGKTAMGYATRWDRWVLEKLGSQTQPGDTADILRACDPSAFPRLRGTQGMVTGVNGTHAPAVMNGAQSSLQPGQFNNTQEYQQPIQQEFSTASQVPVPQFQQFTRQNRTLHEIQQARAARKADIESRCMSLHPPLPADLLQHMPVFHAACQITTPLTQTGWEHLAPRLEEQRARAEYEVQQNWDRAMQVAALRAPVLSLSSDFKLTKDAEDREYEAAQAPLRKRLGEYFSDYINTDWHGGLAIDQTVAPIFVAQALVHIQKRYREDKDAGDLPATPRNPMAKQGTPVSDAFLSLENMRWVHDNEFRDVIGSYGKELFTCAGAECVDEEEPKRFAFESLIQHYAAKHPSSFGKEIGVVHWKTAKWPDKPPFQEMPPPLKLDLKAASSRMNGRARHTLQKTSRNASGMPHATASRNGQPKHDELSWTDRQTLIHDSDRLEEFSKTAVETWHRLDGVEGMLDCVRVHTAIHHAVDRVSASFGESPTLDFIGLALLVCRSMNVICQAQGLTCTVCVDSQTAVSPREPTYHARIKGLKQYSLLSLKTHFQIAHPEPKQQLRIANEFERILELPEAEMIHQLAHAPGMTPDKRGLVDAAFRTDSQQPLLHDNEVKEEPGLVVIKREPGLDVIKREPGLAVIKREPGLDDEPADSRSSAAKDTTSNTVRASSVGPDSGLTNRLLGRFMSKGGSKQRSKKKAAHANGRTNHHSSPETMVEHAENEYDPRRPMHVPSNQALDPARFDTDIARKLQGTTDTKPSPLVLTQEQVALLERLNGTASRGNQAVLSERSPSVGSRGHSIGPVSREHNIGSVTPPRNGSAYNGAPAAVSHISAMIASLQSHLPPAQVIETPATVYPTHDAPYATYDPHRHAPAAPTYISYDPPTAVARNSMYYEQNNQVQRTYAEVPPVQYAPQRDYQVQYAPQHFYPVPRSPPRFRAVHDEPSQALPGHAQPHRQAPVQYTQASAGHTQPQYQRYEQQRPAPQRTIVYDESGRPMELIPIEPGRWM